MADAFLGGRVRISIHNISAVQLIFQIIAGKLKKQIERGAKEATGENLKSYSGNLLSEHHITDQTPHNG